MMDDNNGHHRNSNVTLRLTKGKTPESEARLGWSCCGKQK